MTPNHRPTIASCSLAGSVARCVDIKSFTAGRPTIEKMPISAPSNIQPSSAAASAIHLPEPLGVLPAGCTSGLAGAGGVSKRAMKQLGCRRGTGECRFYGRLRYGRNDVPSGRRRYSRTPSRSAVSFGDRRGSFRSSQTTALG